MGYISITDATKHGDDWTFEFMNPSTGLPFLMSWDHGDGIKRRDLYADDWGLFPDDLGAVKTVSTVDTA
jgi:hypothetical protein